MESLLDRNDSMLRAATRDIQWKKVFLEISQNSQKNTCARLSFLIKKRAGGLQLYLKRGSGAGVFLRILLSFWKHLFYGTPLDDCFYND